MLSRTAISILLTFPIALIVALAPAAHANPVCVTPDGAPCAPPPQGCVQPDNSLPCSSSLPDINAAIRKELQGVLGGLGR
jgi:hypothetical protein